MSAGMVIANLSFYLGLFIFNLGVYKTLGEGPAYVAVGIELVLIAVAITYEEKEASA